MLYNLLAVFIIAGCWIGPEYRFIYLLWLTITWAFIFMNVIVFLPGAEEVIESMARRDKRSMVAHRTKIWALIAITSFILAKEILVAFGFCLIVCPAMYLIDKAQKNIEKDKKNH